MQDVSLMTAAFDEYINGCPHCENAGLRSGVRQPASPPVQPSGETPHARLLEQTRPIQPTAEFVIADFRKWYDSLPYKGADENAMFRDWMYMRLLELYKAHVLGASEPSPREERQSAKEFWPEERGHEPGTTADYWNAGWNACLKACKEAYAAHNSVSVSDTKFNTHDYRIAPGGEGPHAAEWKDKPHRLIYDLCEEIERLQAVSAKRFMQDRDFAFFPPERGQEGK